MSRWIKHSPNPEAMNEFKKLGFGKSLTVNSIYWTCSECNCFGTLVYRFCPNCGAKMINDKEETPK